MTFPPLPVEGTYTDVEREWIDSEPPGLFPGDQASYWGQVRKVFTDQLQVLADLLTTYWLNLDPNTIDESDAGLKEQELGIPISLGVYTLEHRRAFIKSRLEKGPFTRTRRRKIVEDFIIATFGGEPITFGPTGFPFESGGTRFADEETVLAGSYNIVEDIPGFAYDVRILDTIDVDEPGLTRELERITTWPITFTITSTPTP